MTPRTFLAAAMRRADAEREARIASTPPTQLPKEFGHVARCARGQCSRPAVEDGLCFHHFHGVSRRTPMLPQARVLEALGTARLGMTTGEVLSRLTEAGHETTYSAVERALGRAVAAGVVERVEAGVFRVRRQS